MLISGFTVIRNAVTIGYPVVESIRSILPIVDEMVVGVGESDDGTRALIESIGDPKIRIFDSVWDMSRAQRGRILAEKTNEALERCQGDWCFYLQADEVVHERDLPAIRAACERWRDDAGVEGLLFRYLHFYGGYDVLLTARNAYRQEVRIVRRSSGARSVGDAQSFLIDGTRKPAVRWSGATIFHYGWVHSAERVRVKRANRAQLYERPELLEKIETFQMRKVYGLRRFTGTHPAVMAPLVAAQDWEFDARPDLRQWTRKDVKNFLSDVAETLFRKRFGERKKFRLIE